MEWPQEGLAVLCSAIKTNEQTAEQAGSAVTQLSQAMRQAHGLYADELKRIGDDLFDRCPIPQPQPMRV